MNTETFAKTKVGKVALKILGAVMESRFRYRFFGPARILAAADIQPGRSVLEIGCGTGYFTVPAAGMVGERGSLTAIDILSESVEFVTKRVRAAGLTNVRVIKADALDTGFNDGSFDTVLLFGVIPAPMLPLHRLLAELHRVLKPDGTLAVWPPVPGLLPKSILQSHLFTLAGKRNSVYTFKRT
ncbi:conserved hypothetical protein [Candidatus Zixiibacteriota bacterium]|nr:conserved hypothetical protein [candidate division Zixibacteria bacterium]